MTITFSNICMTVQSSIAELKVFGMIHYEVTECGESRQGWYHLSCFILNSRGGIRIIGTKKGSLKNSLFIMNFSY